MHPAFQTVIADAHSRMAIDPIGAAVLIEARSDELEYKHIQAGNGHRRTLDSMHRAGISSFDLIEAIGELRAIARGERHPIQIAAE